MRQIDLNLLVTLEVLLDEGSVARAARRLRLSPSAMSRALARLREATGDPLLVRAGRDLVPTPRAQELRRQIGPLVRAVRAVLSPAENLDLSRLVHTFTLRTSDGFAETFGPALMARLYREAPGVCLHFVPKPDKDSAPLRDGAVDLETGVASDTYGPELRTKALFGDRFIGVVRAGHPLCHGVISAARYAADAGHVVIARHGIEKGPVGIALDGLGLKRRIAAIVDDFSTALALVGATDLVTSVPERHTESLRTDLFSFPLPLAVPDITISMLWHPRMDADPAHRWLRACVLEVCGGHANWPKVNLSPD